MSTSNERLTALINDYRVQFASRWNRQKYIWKAVKTFHNCWDINALDLSKMISNATADADYLMTATLYYPRDMIVGLAKEHPNEVREMFRILAECSKVEVDDALSLAIEKVKEMQNSGQLSGIAGSIKIPDFINGGMLKMLPKDKKMELMEQSMHQEKSRIMAMLQPAISRVIGPVQILDFQMNVWIRYAKNY